MSITHHCATDPYLNLQQLHCPGQVECFALTCYAVKNCAKEEESVGWQISCNVLVALHHSVTYGFAEDLSWWSSKVALRMCVTRSVSNLNPTHFGRCATHLNTIVCVCIAGEA